MRKLALIVLLAFTSMLALQAGGLEKAKRAVQSLQVEVPAATLEKDTLVLQGRDARQQLLVTGLLDDNKSRDLTRTVTYSSAPTGILEVTSDGVVKPLADGTAEILVTSSDGHTGKLKAEVKDAKKLNPINFANQIVPIFTKAGCNAGGCHGKSGGQNGFKLSLLGFEPPEDFEYLVREARGRRIFPASPERSLLLLKGTATVPHGGGKRLEPDSNDYHLLVRWIEQGMPYGKPTDPVISRIEVTPSQRTLELGAEQQLIVMAHYSDGSKEDVTRSALFEPNDKEMAKSDVNGLVKVSEQPGDVAIMVRYQAQVAVFNATIPLGAPIEKLPSEKNFIDKLVFGKLKTMGLPPSDVCDDATFVRRAAIDIAGRVPSQAEAERFLKDQDPQKREKWIDYLLDSPEYADYFANKWAALLRNKRVNDTHTHGTYAFYDWIRDSLAANKPYSKFVQEILAASGEITENPPVAWYRQVTTQNAQLEDTAQLFMGMRLQCAQCHHHPFEKWSQQDYYGFAAFFSQVGRKPGSQPGEDMLYHKRGTATAQHKKTKQSVKPAPLGAKIADIPPEEDPRLVLGQWLAKKDNPFFAKALANRYWKHFFGRGLVDPEDDMRDTNPPTNPELLQALAKHFQDSNYDLKDLVRTICRSHTYQLSSIPNKYNAQDKHNFSRYYPKRLTAEVLFDAVNLVTKTDARFDGLPAGTRAISLPDNSFNANSYFLTVFGRPESSSSCECERSQDATLAQCLHLLNAKEIQEKLAKDEGRAALLALDEKRGEQDKIRDLYLLAYAREPEQKEFAIADGYLKKKLDGKADTKARTTARRQAYEDVLWALINTKEFLFNH